jgi:RNA 2',3'-cyclic 3'-phosphodiesterase
MIDGDYTVKIAPARHEPGSAAAALDSGSCLMEHDLRLFIAIDLPEDVKRLLGELQARLRQHTQALRWGDPRGTHLTLKFLGSTPAGAVPRIVAALEQAVAGRSTFALHTERLGVFPNLKRPRVVWLGVGGDLPALRSLQADVERYVAPLGFPTEQRVFSPHLTLGRSLKDPSPAQLASIGHALQQTEVLQSIVLSVNGIVLMRSELRPQGAHYTALAQVQLDARA